jgi:hypothetical protein
MGQVIIMKHDESLSAGDWIDIPAHVTGVARDVFVLIIGELTPRETVVDSAQTLLIERLAIQLARIREVDPLLRFGYAIADAAEAIKAHCWLMACEFAAELHLPPDTLNRLV